MYHRKITSDLVDWIDQRLAEGLPPETTARLANISPYVVEVIANDHERIGRPSRKTPSHTCYPDRSNSTDIATVRRIRRMLEVGFLNQSEIARETGVSINMVSLIARGKRLPLDTSRPPMGSGERFVKESVRCSVCRRRITIVPCRACRAERERYRPSLN